jgi:hemerythrin superfamily protein
MSQVSEQLIDDHAALDKVLKQLQTALRSSDVETARAKLDLFWARLAVHIRAEHLHLFPAVSSLLDEAPTVIAELRSDHDFFMHELARAVEIMRQALPVREVMNIVLEVEQRLLKHNEVEETQVYRWAITLLNSEEQAKLAKQITTELLKHPPRFTLSTWLDERTPPV